MVDKLQHILDRVVLADDAIAGVDKDGSPYNHYRHYGRDVLLLEDYITELEEEYREPIQWELDRGAKYIVLKDGRDDEFFIEGQEQEAVECLLSNLNHNQYNGVTVPSFIIKEID